MPAAAPAPAPSAGLPPTPGPAPVPAPCRTHTDTAPTPTPPPASSLPSPPPGSPPLPPTAAPWLLRHRLSRLRLHLLWGLLPHPVLVPHRHREMDLRFLLLAELPLALRHPVKFQNHHRPAPLGLFLKKNQKPSIFFLIIDFFGIWGCCSSNSFSFSQTIIITE